MANQKNSLEIMIVSDLHAIACFDCDHIDLDSHLIKNDSHSSEFFQTFLNYVEESSLQPDIIICPGDIGNKAKEENFDFGWKCLNELKKATKAKHLFSVPGNHDHKSRTSQVDFDPKYFLQHASPKFPFSHHSVNTHFWAWHWCHIQGDIFNVILINSSAYHGINDEYKHGRIAPKISDQINEYVDSRKFKNKHLNIVICHHHPTPMNTPGGDRQFMEGAANLFENLLQKQKGAWLIIHGHRHKPAVQYAPCRAHTQPVIISAGSLSKRLDKVLDQESQEDYSHKQEDGDELRNQFQILDIDLIKTKNKSTPVGIFNTHTWTLGSGWELSPIEDIPARGGFGANENPYQLASKFESLLTPSEPLMKEDELKEYLNDYVYFTPADRKIFKDQLELCNIAVTIEKGNIVEIGLKNKYE